MVTQGLILSNRYLILREIGAGGMGVVYEATDLRTGGQVAVKLLHPMYARNQQYVSRLRREAQIAAAIRTPRVVRVMDLDTHENAPYIVMEYVAGQTLSDRLLDEGALPLGEALNVAIEIARALEGAHLAGVLHRDLKPQNVKITVDGEVKVLDFGISRIEGVPGITATDMFTGTPEYCAPERIENEGDIRSDIYSLGIILYELLSGAPPFTAPTAFGVLRKQESEPPPPLPETVPADVRRIVATALAKRAEERYQTPEELLAALRAARDAAEAAGLAQSRGHTLIRPAPGVEPRSQARTVPGGTPTITRTPGVVTEQPHRSRRPWLFASGGLAGVALSAGLGYAVWGTSGDGPTPTPTPTAIVASVTADPTRPPTATPAPTPERPLLLRPGTKIEVNDASQASLRVETRSCPGVQFPTFTLILRVTTVEVLEPRRVKVSYTVQAPITPGLQCTLQYAPDVGNEALVLETLVDRRTQTLVQARSVDGDGIARTGVDNIYGREAAGYLIFDLVEPRGDEISLVQRLSDGKELHRIRIAPR